MPFTLAHPAAVVPFKQSRLANWLAKKTKDEYFVFSALLVGSIGPDLGYLWPGFASQVFTHTLAGVILFGLPTGLCLLWLYHRFLKLPLLGLLPAEHRRVIEPHCGHFSFWPHRRLAAIIFSLFIGALSHIVWDSFTHGQGWMVQAIPFLHTVRFRFVGLMVKPYTILKFGSSIFGLAWLVYCYWRWFQSQPGVIVWPAQWRLGLLVGLFVFVVSSSLGLVWLLRYGVSYLALSTFIRWGLVAGFMVVVGAGLVRKMGIGYSRR